jgi:hypothetical protein
MMHPGLRYHFSRRGDYANLASADIGGPQVKLDSVFE